jgi:oligopeptide transport system substrate-binding protein
MRFAPSLLLFISLLLPARGFADDAPPKADFVYIDRADILTLDLDRMSWMQDIRVADGLWEGLYTLDPKTLACIPGTADHIDINADKTVYVFHIRPTAKWSNGDPVTSNDFLFAWRRMLEEPGEYTYLHHYIKGAEAYEQAFQTDIEKHTKSADFSTVGIVAPDSSTLRVTLKNPLTFFPDLCAFAPFFPQHAKSMEPFRQVDPTSGRVSYDEKFTRPPSLITNGPYRLTNWQLKVGLRMEANPNYWDREHVRSKSIEMIVAPEPLTALRKYNNGEVDWLTEPNGDIAASLLDQHSPDIHVCPSNGTYFYSFNCQPKLPDGSPNPLADVRVRQALTSAIDKKPIVEKITRCGEPVATDYIPPGIFPGYISPPGLPFDIKAARKLMKAAGYPGGRGFPSITLLYNSEGDHKVIAEYVTKQWKDNLNLDIQMEGVEIAEFRERLHNKKYAIARASWYGDYNDLSTFTDKYLSTSDNNDTGWGDPKYDDLCTQATLEPDPIKRTALLQQAETILLDAAPILPLYGYTNKYVFPANVTGLYLNSRNQVLFKAMSAGR